MKIEKSVFFERNRKMAVSLAENEMVDKMDERLEFQVCTYTVHIYIYICMWICKCICKCIYMYVDMYVDM
jgi:hypothetical protein